ncbi:hypothetical protein ANN_11234 [Periplaneta americana]|uniref:Uncharacterized protein n=1 Tax=Periplaneta americana TaxID=6978 RepID=A0ABQ8T5R6_PERAM|nr:hypothetical protein ANN_11234 [Periplaneta americana]
MGRMAGLCEGGNEPPASLKASDNAGEMSPGSSTESYPAFARIGLRENPGKNLNQVTCPVRDSNPGHLVSQPDALTVTPQHCWCNLLESASDGILQFINGVVPFLCNNALNEPHNALSQIVRLGLRDGQSRRAGFIKSIVAQERYDTIDELKDAVRRSFNRLHQQC